MDFQHMIFLRNWSKVTSVDLTAVYHFKTLFKVTLVLQTEIEQEDNQNLK